MAMPLSLLHLLSQYKTMVSLIHRPSIDHLSPFHRPQANTSRLIRKYFRNTAGRSLVLIGADWRRRQSHRADTNADARASLSVIVRAGVGVVSER